MIIYYIFLVFPSFCFASFPVSTNSYSDTIPETKKETLEEYRQRIQKQLYSNDGDLYEENKSEHESREREKIRSWILAYSAGQKVDLENRSYVNDPKIGNHSYYVGYRFNSFATGLILNGGAGIFLRAYFLDNFYFNFEATENPDILFGMNTTSNIIGFGYELQLSDIISLTPRISYYRIKDHIFVDHPDPNIICLFCIDEIELNGLLLNLGLQFNLGKNRKRKSFKRN